MKALSSRPPTLVIGHGCTGKSTAARYLLTLGYNALDPETRLSSEKKAELKVLRRQAMQTQDWTPHNTQWFAYLRAVVGQPTQWDFLFFHSGFDQRATVASKDAAGVVSLYLSESALDYRMHQRELQHNRELTQDERDIIHLNRKTQLEDNDFSSWHQLRVDELTPAEVAQRLLAIRVRSLYDRISSST